MPQTTSTALTDDQAMAHGSRMFRELSKRLRNVSRRSCGCWGAPAIKEFSNGQDSGPGSSRSGSFHRANSSKDKARYHDSLTIHVFAGSSSTSTAGPSVTDGSPSWMSSSASLVAPQPQQAADSSSNTIPVITGGPEPAQEPGVPPSELDPAAPVPSRPCALAFGSSSEQNARSHMEDRLIFLNLTSLSAFLGRCARAGLVAVFDGHGGHQAAELLVSLLSQQLLLQPDILANPAAALQVAVAACEVAVLAELAAGGWDGAGSTLAAALVIDDVLVCANVGDSRVVLARGAEAVQITRDHKPSCAIEQARITAADPEATITSDGYLYGELAVGRALGSPKLKSDASRKALVATPELFTNTLGAGDDFLVLASDGLWDALSNKEVVQTVRRSLASERNADVAAAAVVRRAMQLGSNDNISAVVVLLHDRPILLPKSNSRLFSRCATTESTTSDGGASRGSLSSSSSMCGGSASSPAAVVEASRIVE